MKTPAEQENGGRLAIVVIAVASPLHRPNTAADREAFERGEQAVRRA